MEFRIADTFTDSLAKLTGEEQKAVKTTAFDLQLNPANRGMGFHKLDRARDKSFWSVRASRDIRLIVHRTEASLMLCYVAYHDDAYQWAERRRLETHPRTGAAQLVEIRERIEEISVPKYVDAQYPEPSKPALFSGVAEDVLLGYGVPVGWLDEVRRADEDSLLELADHLPGEAADALLELATGGQPEIARPQPAGVDPFAHPDAQRRFRVMADVEELARALDYPWDKWTVFLHPAQRRIVEKDFKGPARVSGSAGTGKTIVALHRAVFLARGNPDARVLLTTFSEPLANALRVKLARLISNEPRIGERLEVHAIDAVGERLYALQFGAPMLASPEVIRQLLSEAANEVEGYGFSKRFLLGEWADVIDAWQLDSWEAYRDVRRLGRRTRLPERQRALLWSIFERVRQRLSEQEMVTSAAMFSALSVALKERKNPPFEFAVIDEAQDISVQQLCFLAALAGERPNGLFFSGDLGQRIFQQPFSWLAFGVDIRGRSRALHINYRTSHQIRMQADRLLGPELSDVDGNTEDRRGTVSAFNGPYPVVLSLPTPDEETRAVAQWLADRSKEGIAAHEVAVFVRSKGEIGRAKKAVEEAELAFKLLDKHLDVAVGKVSVCTMHLAKGLEFRAVAVMACDDEVIPLQDRIENVADDADLQEVYDTERHLLYVACTRARDRLLVTSGDVPSEFLEDLDGSQWRGG
jgi:superfamily I DNA/RNA helicase/mRNA-degrading endonuclease RelE of RelBE toxin-antitoxin system